MPASGSMIVIATIAVSLLAGCTTGGSTAVTSTSTISSPPSDRGSSVGVCTAATVRQLVDQFVQAFNVGGEATPQQYWAEEGRGFAWYSTDASGQRIGSAAKNRTGLAQYFADRNAAGESLRLTSFQFNGNGAGYGDFQYTLIRRADDLPPTPYIGKGATICGSMPELIAWSMSTTPAALASAGPGRAACQPASPITKGVIQGTPVEPGTSLVGTGIGEVRSGQDTKLVFRITGDGDVRVDLLDEAGTPVAISWGPRAHSSSNFDHPGREWGVGFVIPAPGCWEVRVSTQTSRGSFWFRVDS